MRLLVRAASAAIPPKSILLRAARAVADLGQLPYAPEPRPVLLSDRSHRAEDEMWASVQRIRVQNGADDGDVARRISEELVPALLEDAGASRCWWAVDPSSRVVLGVTLWSDQTACFEGHGSAARIRAGALDPLGAHTLVDRKSTRLNSSH